MRTDESETVSFEVRSVCEGRTTSIRPDEVEIGPDLEGAEECVVVVVVGEKCEGDDELGCWLLAVGPPSSLVFCAGTRRSI